MIAQALQANPSLRAAQAALWQAKENLYAQKGKLLPTRRCQQFGDARAIFTGGIRRDRTTFIFNLFQATVNVSYAPDVFGGQRRQVEAEAALADYQRFELEATYLTLTANVVTAAVAEASLRGQIAVTLDIIKVETDQLEVVRQQFNVGAATRTDVLTQESEVATTQATLPPLQKQLEQERHILLALIGRFPNERLRDRLTLASLRLPTDLPLSLPSQLVEQRPDVRAAQAQLHQASAQIGVAVAAMLPQFTLTGEYGAAGATAASLFNPSTIIWTAAASGTQPIFHGFTLLHQERAAKAAYDMAEAQYRNTVLAAFQNVADALRALQLDAATLKAQRAALRAAADTLRSGARPVSPRRHHLPDAAQCPTQLRAGAARSGASAGGALRRYRRAVPGARRRLVEPHRCAAQSAEPGGAWRGNDDRYRAGAHATTTELKQ